jgi:hypothetical protein
MSIQRHREGWLIQQEAISGARILDQRRLLRLGPLAKWRLLAVAPRGG